MLTPLQLQKLKPNRARELLMSRGIWSRVSVIEHHYYHFDEVWHAVYNRAERRHLNGAFCLPVPPGRAFAVAHSLVCADPENLDFKDDQSKERQVNLFKSIMVRPHPRAWARPAWRALSRGVCLCWCVGVDGA